jgi:flagellar basal body-associated protein FliL
MADTKQSKYGYGKRPLWQWIVIYLVIGAIVYGLIYYFVFAKKGGYNYSPQGGNQYQYPTQQ